jgi:hypothetical protein
MGAVDRALRLTLSVLRKDKTNAEAFAVTHQRRCFCGHLRMGFRVWFFFLNARVVLVILFFFLWFV